MLTCRLHICRFASCAMMLAVLLVIATPRTRANAIPPGMRFVSILVDPKCTQDPNLMPGDYVDVYVPSRRHGQVRTRLVVRGAQLLDISLLGPDFGSGQSPAASYPGATVFLTVGQARRLLRENLRDRCLLVRRPDLKRSPLRVAGGDWESAPQSTLMFRGAHTGQSHVERTVDVTISVEPLSNVTWWLSRGDTVDILSAVPGNDRNDTQTVVTRACLLDIALPPYPGARVTLRVKAGDARRLAEMRTRTKFHLRYWVPKHDVSIS